jgi:hypothetical protein
MPTSSRTPIPSATFTVTATPTPAWKDVKVLSVTNQGGGVLVTLSVPNVSKAYTLFLGGEKYACTPDAKTPGELFCWGLAIPPVGVPQNITFIDPDDGTTVYQGSTVVTNVSANGDKIIHNNTCAGSGTKQSCEMECRIDPTNNQPCIVASCFDACGLTLSIQTCSNDAPLESFSMCDAETQAAMKKLYGLP